MKFRKKLVSFPYMFYNEEIIPKINNLKGAHWLNVKLAELNNFVVDEPDEEPTNVLEKEWDNLIILDACRYDYFKEYYPETEKIISVGTHSRHFFENTFTGRECQDVIYITGNPHLKSGKFEDLTGSKLGDTFHSVYQTWDDGWEGKDYMPPEPIVRDAKTAEKLFPEKRKIIHFMQPHDPYVGGEEVWRLSEVWKGNRTLDEAREAYRKNIEFIIPHIEDLADSLEGKTVVSADHGDFLGEYGLLAHPYGVNAKELREVPWHVMD